jgi:hypothetical protein
MKVAATKFKNNCTFQYDPKRVRRRNIAKIIVIVAISALFISWVGIWNYVLDPRLVMIDRALGQLARAESAQTPNEVIGFLTIAKGQLPESGAVHWWSPENANFEEIQAKLDEIISRAQGISSFDVYDEHYNMELYAIHAEIGAIQEILVAF